MVEGKTMQLVIKLSDKEGVLRGKADRPFSHILEQIAKLQRIDPESVLEIYEAYCQDEQLDICWVIDEDSYRYGMEFALQNRYQLFLTRLGGNEEWKQEDSDNQRIQELERINSQIKMEFQHYKNLMQEAHEAISKTALHQVEELKRAHADQMNQLHDECVSFRDQAAQKDSELKSLQRKMDQLTEENQKQVHDIEAENKKLKEDKESLERKYADICEVLKQNNEEKADFKRKMVKAQAEQIEMKTNLQKSLEQQQNALEKEIKAKAALQLDVDMMKAEHSQLEQASSSLTSVNEQMTAQMKVLTQERDETRIEINRVMSENDNIRAQAGRLEVDSTSMINLQEKLERTEKEKEEIENDRCIKIVEYNDLKQNFDVVRTNSRSFQKKVKDLEKFNSELEEKLDQRNTSCHQLQALIKNMKQSMAASSHDEKHLEKLKAEVKSLKMVASMRENDCKVLSKQLEQASNQDEVNESLKNELKNITQENNDLKAEIIYMQKDMSEQQTTVDNLYESKAFYKKYFALNQNLKEERHQRKANREKAGFIEDQQKEISNLRSEKESERDYTIITGSEDSRESSKPSEQSYRDAVTPPRSFDCVREQIWNLTQIRNEVPDLNKVEEQKRHSSPCQANSIYNPTQIYSPTRSSRTNKPNFSDYKVMKNSQRTSNIECQTAKCHKRVLIQKNKTSKCWMYKYWSCSECHFKLYGRCDPPESFLCARCSKNE